MNLKKLLCIFIGVAFSIYAFAQSLENGSGDPQASDFERNILSAFNAYPQRPCKILVYSGKDCFVEKGNPHSVIELFSVLEKRAIPQISVTFTTSISQFDSNNLRKFDCVVLVSASKDFFEDSVVKSLPQPLLENEREKSEKYALSLKTYVEDGGMLFLISSEIPRVLNVQYGNIAHSKKVSNIPILVQNHFITRDFLEGEDRFLVQDDMCFEGESFDVPKNMHVILSLDREYFPSAKQNIPIAWEMDYSKGKILNAAFNANKNLLEYPDLLGFYVRCLNYAFNGSSAGAGKARVASPETSIVYLRYVEDEGSDIYQSVSRKINEFISKNPKKKDSIGNLCVNDLKKNIGTCLYKKFLSEILLRTSLKSESDVLIKEIQVLSSDMNNKKCVRNLIAAVGESKDAKRVENLEKLLSDSDDYIVLNALRAISKIRDPRAISIAKTHSYGILKDDSKSKELKEQAVKSLLEIGEHVDLSLISKDSIGYLGNSRHLKMPENINFDSISEDLYIPLVNVLVLRKEGYDGIISLNVENSKMAYAVTNAIVKFAKCEDLKKAFSFAKFYTETEKENAAELIASIKIDNKTERFWALKPGMDADAKELLIRTLCKVDSAEKADFLYGILSGKNSAEDKLIALDILKKYEGKRAYIASVAREKFESSPKLEDRLVYLQLLSLEQTEASADLCIYAYNIGLRDAALKELSNWRDSGVLDKLFQVYKNQNLADQKDLERVAFLVIKNSKAFDCGFCEYLLKNAQDKEISQRITKLKRGDLKDKKMQNVCFGINAASSCSDNLLKNAFDGGEKTKWESGKDKNWIVLEFGKTRCLKGIEITFGGRAEQLKFYAGMDLYEMEDVVVVETHVSETKNRYLFKAPLDVKFLKIENLKDIDIFKIEFLNDSSVYKKGLDRVGGRCIASASDCAKIAGLAFDNKMETSWSSNCDREPGQWFLIGLDKIRDVSSIELMTGPHKNSRALSPKIYTGKTLDDLSPVDASYIENETSDVIKLKNPQNIRFIVIENNGEKPVAWRIAEIKVK